MGLGCPGRPDRVAYDLANRVAFAERSSSAETLLFGAPGSEPQLVEGFYRENRARGGDAFLWATAEAEILFHWARAEPRIAILDLAPYHSLKGQAAEVRLNGRNIATLKFNDDRFRYRIDLPLDAQLAGENRLRFAFARTASPADQDPKNGDKRHLAAAFYSLVVGGPGAIEDLLARDAPRPFAIDASQGAPELTQVGPGSIRYALRLPEDAEFRFSPALHPAARRAAAAATFRVTLETAQAPERELWEATIRSGEPAPGEVRLALPADAGEIVRLGLHVGGADRFAWGVWRAPRVTGRNADVEPLAPAGWSESDDVRSRGLREATAGSNVLLVILDAARARQFGAYGYAKSTTPVIDRIAREGVRFDAAFTPAVYTLAAMSSIWTSQYPDRHHSEVSFSARLPRDRLTLAEVLSGRGVHTAGFVANAVAGTVFGFERGFDEFHETFRELGSGAGGFRHVLPDWFAANKGRRFFAYVHFREPHFPYDPPAPFDTRFGPDFPLSRSDRASGPFFTDVNQGRRAFSTGEQEHLVRLYDGNLAYADQELGEIRRVMEAQGLWEKTVVIVAADHGEELREHGWIGHNVHVYDESARVPLIVRFPGGKGPSGARVAGLVDLLDLAPTIADLMGVRGEGPWRKEFQGRSLLPMIAGAPGKAAVVSRTVWDQPVYGFRDAAFRFVYNTRTGEEQLFDLSSDPAEAHDVASTHALRAAYCREALYAWMASLAARSDASAAETPPWTRDQCENMKSLGYLGADVKCPEE